MKFLVLVLSVVLYSQLSFASGKISLKGSYYPGIAKAAPTFGIAVYEPLFLGIAYNQWSGFGYQPRAFERSVMWFASKHDLEVWHGDFGVAAGFTYRHAEQPGVFEAEDQSDVHVQVSYRLW